MDTVVFSPDCIYRLNRKVRISIVLILAAAVVCTGACIAMCCMASDSNYIVWEVVSIVLFTLFGWFGIGFYFFYIRPAKKEIAFIKHMCSTEPAVVDAKVVRIEDEITLQNYLTVYPVVTDNSQNEVLYRRKTAAQNAMDTDTSYRFYVVDGFIVRYEKSV